MNELQVLLNNVRENRWCVQPYCTTCGARDYRLAVQAQVPALITALRETDFKRLRQECRDIDLDAALHLMMMELDGLRGGSGLHVKSLDDELAGSDAGRFLEGMRGHSLLVACQRAEAAAFESPEAVAERRQLRQRQNQLQQDDRMRQKRQRDEIVASAIHSFAVIDPATALEHLLKDPAAFPLYRMPVDLVASLAELVGTLPDVKLLQLRNVVPVTSVMPLSVLSLAIDAELQARLPKGP